MPQYVDSSALLKRYVHETDSTAAQRLLASDPEWVCGAHTEVEVRRTLSVRFAGDAARLRRVREAFQSDWSRCGVVLLDVATCRLAAELAELTGARTLDALHLACAQRAGAPAMRMLTFDVRLSAQARALGWTVVGV